MKYLNLFFQKRAIIGKNGKFKEWNAKNRIKKNFIFQWDILRIQRDKTPIGLHGERGKSNLTEGEP